MLGSIHVLALMCCKLLWPLMFRACIGNSEHTRKVKKTCCKCADSPPSFQEWVRRCNRAHPDRREAMRARIKAVLEPLVKDGSWARHNWDREPIPSLDDTPASSTDDLVDLRKDRYSRRRPSPDSDGSNASLPSKRSAPAQRGRQSKQAKSKGKKASKWGSVPGATAASVSARAQRFGTDAHASPAPVASAAVQSRPDDDDDDWHAANVIVQGQCQALEKEFLRLNGAPDPGKVRPEAVIQQALDRLVGMMARSEQPYRYHWSQLKAMRQDLTVQHIRSEVTAQVEEAFARRALEHGDMRNYQKCSTALRVLYDAGVAGARAEFDAYRILANVCQDHCTPDEVLKAIRDAYAHGVGDAAEVQHALAVQRALSMGNWRGFWKLYARAPLCGRHVMACAAPAVRLAAARALVVRFKPAADAGTCTAMLGFDVPSRQCAADAPLPAGCSHEQRHAEADAASAVEQQSQCRTFLQQLGAVVSAADGAAAGAWELRAKENKSDALKLPDKDDLKQHKAPEVKMTDFSKVFA